MYFQFIHVTLSGRVLQQWYGEHKLASSSLSTNHSSSVVQRVAVHWYVTLPVYVLKYSYYIVMTVKVYM